MDNPRSPAECQFLPGQHITAPPQFLPGDVAHQHHDRIVDGNPPASVQWDAHEVVWTKMAEELAAEPRRIEKSHRLYRGLNDCAVTLDEHPYQDRNDYPFSPRPLAP